jgi:hypothetical protein
VTRSWPSPNPRTPALRPCSRSNATEQQLDARITATEQRLVALVNLSSAESRASVWKVVVGTGIALYLATVGTLGGGFGFVLRILDVI